MSAEHDHVLGNPAATITLLEYGSYTCPRCQAAHEVIANLRDRFGDRMRYVFRHRPSVDPELGRRAAVIAEYAHRTGAPFWKAHDVLMKRGPKYPPGELERISEELGLPAPGDATEPAWREAERKVDEDTRSARRSGALLTPTFFINGRRYEGTWDEHALAGAMEGTLGHRLRAASLDFVRWGPSTGFLMLLATIAAVALFNSASGPTFAAWWHAPLALGLGDRSFSLPVIDWINHGLLTLFFLVVGLEIKRELTVGHLASLRAAALPVAASIGGMVFPALIYTAIAGGGPYARGWGVPIATDTAFAIAVIALLGDRVAVELRIFLTAAVIVDDLASIGVIALVYTDELRLPFLLASGGLTLALFLVNRASIYRPLPYAALGLGLWLCLHASGVHPTLAGVILAMAIPTRPPANLRALLAHAETVIREETLRGQEAVLRHGPSEPALNAIDAIHDRIESPAQKVLRAIEPWSSYLVLPIFALGNAGVVLSLDVAHGHGPLMLAIALGLVIGKSAGILAGAALAVRLGLAVKPDVYSWRQLAGAAILGGIGFTMSLFIAAQAYQDPDAFAAAKIAIFMASVSAAGIGIAVLWPRRRIDERPSVQ